MKVDSIEVEISEMPSAIRDKISEGFGLANLYAREVNGGHSLEALLVDRTAVSISSPVSGRSYPSITPRVPFASLYEREIFETTGLYPEGHPDMRPLRSRTVWGARKGSASIPHNGMVGESIFEIPVGPIHAGVIGPGHFRFSVAGEPVLLMRTYLGYSRRGAERLLLTKASADNTVITERISGDNAVAHTLAYLQAIEQDTEIPIRARYLRSIYSELERIYNHLGGIAGIALDTALAVPSSQGSMLREKMLRLNDRICGHRLLWGTLKLGGVRNDLSDAVLSDIETTVMNIKLDVDELFGVMVRSPSFMDRAETTGRLTQEDALRLRTVGPVARASGIDYDVRKHIPYAAYEELGLRVFKCPSGDVYARLSVKKNEISESVSMIGQCISYMKDGPICADVNVKDGFSVGIVESPRGELVHCVHIEDGKITGYKIRDPSFPNWPALECAILGNIIPDFPVVNKSFDLSYSGNDL
ncbi:MAG: NADH-quinone oxidoreductase subunit C [Candidatus Methanoplasma sp.]|jgi:Ni,Fe-hydrogenase III large subunit|nr:NADH-quinone oxidoreductase subunit C [Candidatus Methanoplasma sp.]